MSTGDSVVVTVREHEDCPVTSVLRRVGDKWCPVIIRLLAEREYGYNELDRAIEGVSRRMLTRSLRALEEDGFVTRTARAEAPFRVEYGLTELGRSLRDQLRALGRWAVEHDGDLRG
jgi:DNA-binding HxlR family transcriptional regulator